MSGGVEDGLRRFSIQPGRQVARMANGKLARKVNEQMAENRGAGAPVP